MTGSPANEEGSKIDVHSSKGATLYFRGGRRFFRIFQTRLV